MERLYASTSSLINIDYVNNYINISFQPGSSNCTFYIYRYISINLKNLLIIIQFNSYIKVKLIKSFLGSKSLTVRGWSIT